MINLSFLPPPDNIVPFPTKSNEWYTPARYIEAARAVMGSIDLDPASCELANRTVKAARFYSAKENGLAQEWSGNVWLNPPYARDNTKPNGQKSTINHWVRRLIQCYQLGGIKQAILLTTTRTDASWFELLWEYPVCFSNHHLYFNLGRDGDVFKNTHSGHMFGTCFVYLGKNEQTFIDIFSEFGTVARRVSQPKRAVTPLS